MIPVVPLLSWLVGEDVRTPMRQYMIRPGRVLSRVRHDRPQPHRRVGSIRM